MTKIFVLIATWAFISGCEVTAEKIELWKGTKNGPKKLASALIDPEIPLELRAKAAVALVEISSRGWDLFMQSFPKMEKEDSAKVIEEIVPILAAMVEKEEKAVTKSQVDAKDALYILLDYAAGTGKFQAEQALISWSTKDFNTRALAGKYNITAIVKKIGPAAAEAMIPLLTVNEVTVEHIAKLVRKAGDEKALKKASAGFAQNIQQNVNQVNEIDLVSAAIIGGESIGNTLLDIATNQEVTAKLQRFSLRAFSDGVSQKSIELTDGHAGRLFAMAQNSAYDKYQREETYYVIAQAGRKQDIPVFEKLLSDRDSFWRAVAFRCILRIDGAGQLQKTLSHIARLRSSRNKDDVREIIDRIASFPKLLPTVRGLLGDSNTFVRGIAVNVLSKLGTAKDVPTIQKLVENTDRLPRGFGQKSLGEAALAALEAIKKKG